jgi:hypothetical protein
MTTPRYPRHRLNTFSLQHDLVLNNTGDGWNGTMSIVVRHLVDDILSDGAPFTAELFWFDEDTDTSHHEVEVVVTGYSPSRNTFTLKDGRVINFGDVTGIGV